MPGRKPDRATKINYSTLSINHYRLFKLYTTTGRIPNIVSYHIKKTLVGVVPKGNAFEKYEKGNSIHCSIHQSLFHVPAQKSRIHTVLILLSYFAAHTVLHCAFDLMCFFLYV